MADGQRVYPVDYVVLHHSTGPEFDNSTDLEVQDWYDRIGAGRGYAGKTRSYHDHPQRAKETFAQAQLALRKYSLDGNKYGWRLTPLMKDIWNNVAWHAGNWPVNQRSIGIETCGNYVDRQLPEKALMLIADFFREHDKNIGGILQITAHKQFSATACPGGIFDQRATVVDMINNPDKWNAKLFPAPKPEPKPEPKPDWKKEAVELAPTIVAFIANKDTNLVEIDTGKVVKATPKGTSIGIRYQYKGFYITQWSYDNNIKNGFKIEDLNRVVPSEPAPVEPDPKPEPEKPKIYGIIGYDSKESGQGTLLIMADTETGLKEKFDKMVQDLEAKPDGKYYEFVEMQDGKILKVINSYQSKMSDTGNTGNEQSEGSTGEKYTKISESLKSTLTQWAIPVQGVTYVFGVIFAYHNPDMPIEVVLAYSGLFGLGFNLVKDLAEKLAERYLK